MVEPIVKTVVVDCAADKAFDVFTRQTTNWWPRDKHAVSAMNGESAKSVTIEGHVGGAIYEIMPDGSRIEWGIVTAYTDGESIAMTWHPGTGPEEATEVSVSFKASEGGKTEVTLVHSNWDILGEAAQVNRDGYDGGWVFVFETCFLEAC